MSDFINKVITIVSKEETKTKAGTNTKVKLVDQDGVKYSYFKKKKDGALSSAAEQFKDMGLDENSVVQISWVLDTYEVEGKSITENKVTGFRETSEQPVMGQVPAPRPQPVKQNEYKPTKEQEPTDWDKIAVGKCQTVFLQAYIQSGKTFSEAKLQVTQARQLAELVVYGTQQKDEAPLPEAPPETDSIAEGLDF